MAEKSDTVGPLKEIGSTPALAGFDDKPKKNYVPEGFKTKEDYLQDLRETYSLDVEFDHQNRVEAIEDKKFAAGEQWDPVVRAQREGLPCLTINTVPQFTAQLVGDWRQSRNAVKVVPSENGDKEVASIRSDLIRAIETKSRAARVYDSAFESMVTCGDGAFQISVDYSNEDVFDQEIVIKPIDDALSVVWDRMSIDPTARDATHCFVDELYPRKEFERLWPDADPSELSPRLYSDMVAGGWVESDFVRVTAHWRMVTRDKLLVLFEDGSIHHLDDDLDELTEQHGAPVRSRIAPCRYAQMHLVTGFDILSGPYEYKLSRLPVIRMVGRVMNLGARRVRYGLVRPMKDSVRLRNFFRSIAAEQLGYAPKAQWIATESAVEGYEDDFRRAHLTRDPLLKISDDAVIGQNIQRLDPPAIEAALLNEAQINTQDLKDVTGIHDASLGIKSNETSGRAIMARQREGDIASLTYYDNGNASILEGGDVVNQLIGQIYDGTRIIRIIGEDEQAKLLKVNDPFDPNSPDIATGVYDVAITTGASYTTRRVEAAQAMMEAVQVFPQMMEVAGDIVAKAQDWPGAQELADRLRKTIPPQYLAGEKDDNGQPYPGGPDPQTQQMIAEGAQKIQELTRENEQLKTEAEIKIAKLKIDEFNAETDRIKVLGELNYKNRESREEATENLSRM